MCKKVTRTENKCKDIDGKNTKRLRKKNSILPLLPKCATKSIECTRVRTYKLVVVFKAGKYLHIEPYLI